MKTEPLKIGYSYSHRFGFISIENWGKPFLIITQDSYLDADHYSYYYFKLEVCFDTEIEARNEVKRLNELFSLKEAGQFFNSNDSKEILFAVQKMFPLAEIVKPEFKTI
jgi:hypothetical protein